MTTEVKYRNIVKPCNNVQDMADALLAIYNLVTAADELSDGDAVEIEQMCEAAGIAQAAECPCCGDLYTERIYIASMKQDGHCGCED